MKDRLARWAMRSEKTEGRDLRREEGMKSREEVKHITPTHDLAALKNRTLRFSAKRH